MFLLQNLCHTDWSILGTSFARRELCQVLRHAESSTLCPPQGACLPRTPSMVLRTPSWFCAGFSSFSLFPSLTPRGYPQSSANCSLERSPHIHSFTYHPHTNPKYKPAPQTPITSIWPRHFKCIIGFQSPHKNPASSLKCGRHVP